MLKFVCDALRGRVDANRASALTPDQWQAALAIATAGRVETMFARGLGTHLDESVARTLQRRARRIAFAWMWAERELENVLKVFAANDTAVVVLKGHAIAPLVYPDAAMRSTNDIDLLVHHDQMMSAADILSALGYIETNLFPTRPASAAAYHERVFSRELVAGRVRQPIELHTGFAQSFRHPIPYSELIDRSVPFGDALRLSDEDQLLHFAVHSAREQFLGPLKQLLDVHLWITQRELDWDTVITRALDYGLAGSLSETLRLTTTLFDTPLPGEVAHLSPGPLRQGWLSFWHQPNDNGLTRWPASMRTAQLMALMPLLDSTAHRVRFLAHYTSLRARDLWARRLVQ